jgi:hypothetical protein
MLDYEITTVYWNSHSEYVTTLCGQKEKFGNVKADNAYSNH